MIRAVNATRTPIFCEGSVFETCTQKLRDLAAKIGEIFMSILRTILPCVFGKSETPVAAVVQQPDPRVVAVQQEALPAAPAQNPAPAPAAEPLAPRVEPAAVAAAAAPAAAARPEEPAAAAAAAAAVVRPEEPAAAAAAAAAAADGPPEEPAADAEWADWPDAPPPPPPARDGARSPDHRDLFEEGFDDNQFGPLARQGTNSSGASVEEDSDGEGERKVRARAATLRAAPFDPFEAGVQFPPAPQRAATAAPRVLVPKKTGLLAEGVSGLVPENQGAAIYVVLSAILNLGRGVQEGKEVTTRFLDAVLGAGVELFEKSKHGQAAQISVDDIAQNFEGLDEVPFGQGAAAHAGPAESKYKGTVDTRIALLHQTAIANRGFLTAVLCKGTEENPRTFGLFIRNAASDEREFYLVNPYGPNGKISLHRFVDLNALKGHFVREVAPEVMGNDDENHFWVIPLQVREDEEEAAAAAAAAPAGFGLRRTRSQADRPIGAADGDEMDEAAGAIDAPRGRPSEDEAETF